MSSDYGTYRLVFEPPTDQITPGVEMTLSGEADLTQMLALFEAFLQASGYQLGEKSLELAGPDTLKVDKDGFISFSDYPMAAGSGVDFVAVGGATNDVITFGSTPPSGIDGSYWGGK